MPERGRFAVLFIIAESILAEVLSMLVAAHPLELRGGDRVQALRRHGASLLLPRGLRNQADVGCQRSRDERTKVLREGNNMV